ncbi:heme-binding protein [Vibrio profundum]|uniref:GlcG/HbpS family heme-binding protein n=1 Tax=Vibrio profundum TaxID=2910247 RepID=UPI003D11C93F
MDNVKKLPSIILTTSLLFSSTLFAKSLPTAPYLPLELAQAAANAAMKQCIKDGYNVSVAVVARTGETKVLLKGDNTGPHTASSAIGKAFTSASMGRDTMGLAKFISDRRDMDGLRDMDSRMVIQGGGLPIVIDGSLVAGIGVGGAPGGDKDEACAAVGVKSITP